MSELTVQRTPDVIAAEIRSIDNQARSYVMQSIVEIGRRLVEAKEQLQHGEWGKWLEEQVDYSHSTANNFMKIYREFSDKIAITGNFDFGSLSYTKAIALLGVPSEEREQFAVDNDIENMSARQLEQAVREKKEAEERAKAAEEQAAKEREAREKLEKQSKARADEVERLKEQLAEAEDAGDQETVRQLEDKLETAEDDLVKSREKIRELEQQLLEKPIEAGAVVEVIPPETQAELEELRAAVAKHSNNEATMKFRFSFDALTNRFQTMLDALDQIPEEERGRYKAASLRLIDKMTERLQ